MFKYGFEPPQEVVDEHYNKGLTCLRTGRKLEPLTSEMPPQHLYKMIHLQKEEVAREMIRRYLSSLMVKDILNPEGWGLPLDLQEFLGM